jgi:hypothetical protein
MPIDALFRTQELSDPPALAVQIGRTVERARSHAVSFGGCGCSAGMLSTVGFAEFETLLICHFVTDYPELAVHPLRTIEDVVGKSLSLPGEKAKLILTSILRAITSYAEQCRAFRADEQD